MGKPKRGRIRIPRQPVRLPPRYSDPTNTTPTFQPRPPLKTARGYALRELEGKALPAEIVWLHENPLLWLRALTERELRINTAIDKDRAELVRLRPPHGQWVPPEYLELKKQVQLRSTQRNQTKQHILEKKAEVASLISHNPKLSTGDLVIGFVKIAQLLEDDDVRAAHDAALWYAERLKGR